MVSAVMQSLLFDGLLNVNTSCDITSALFDSWGDLLFKSFYLNVMFDYSNMPFKKW